MKLWFIAFMLSNVFSLEYLIKPESTMCLWEDIEVEDLVIAEIKVKEFDDLKVLHMVVNNPTYAIIYDKKGQSSFVYSMVAAEAGPYQFCVKNYHTERLRIVINLKIGIHANDFIQMATRSDFFGVESSLSKAESMVKTVKNGLRRLREKEEQMRKTNESIHDRIIAYSIMTLIVLVVLALIQVIYLKRFFVAKKII